MTMTLNNLLAKLDAEQLMCIMIGDAKAHANAESAEMILSKDVLEANVSDIKCKESVLYVWLIDEPEEE